MHRLLVMMAFWMLVLGGGESSARSLSGETFVHLFEWSWSDVARECESVLGPSGYHAVQVSPPQEHITQGSMATGPWWQRYQPVSYKISSRGGSLDEFRQMVTTCTLAGVGVYVDAVINHMTGQRHGTVGIGSGGSYFSHYQYPDYGPEDFHYCGTPGHDINDYTDAFQVRNCELLNLADLKTESPKVRDRLAAYLEHLLRIGVEGFRIDAAKHLPPDDIRAILDLVRTRAVRAPFIFQEVIDFGVEPVKGGEYFSEGMVTEFRYGHRLAQVFRRGKLHYLNNGQTFGEKWGFYPSHKAVVFIDNHDNQRGHGSGGNVLTHRDGRAYILANVLMLAWPYGYPKVMSSYYFQNSDQGPPAKSHDDPCESGFVCEHRSLEIKRMVAFRKLVTDRPLASWYSNGQNQIAFSRGSVGFVAMNADPGRFRAEVATSLADGSYCSWLLQDGSEDCPPINVRDGKVSLDLDSGEVLVLVDPQAVVSQKSKPSRHN